MVDLDRKPKPIINWKAMGCVALFWLALIAMVVLPDTLVLGGLIVIAVSVTSYAMYFIAKTLLEN